MRDELAGRTIGDFVLRERIGEGGFGAVYRCEQPLLGRAAVIKVLHRRLRANETVRQRFLREAKLASLLDHPYAAHVYAFGIEDSDGLCWIAMEMVHGTTLDRMLRERGKLPLDQFVPFFERVAEVVHTAHEAGIVHRDLKPSNIMVIERAGRLLPKLLDFGVAKLLGDEPIVVARPPTNDGGAHDIEVTLRERPRALAGDAPPPPTPSPPPPATSSPTASSPLTEVDARIGSPPYMSPEQWRDNIAVGPRSDLYSLGVIAFECLAGRRPFSAPTSSGMAELHCSAPVPALGGELPAALDPFMARTLAKAPAERWGTALELAAHLRIAAGLATPPTDLPRLPDELRDAWLRDAPQPIAEAVAALDAARSVHQARDTASLLARSVVRYLTAVALAARAQVRRDHDSIALTELLRAVRARDLDDAERVRLLRELARPFADCRDAHPVPELVAFAGGGELDRVLAELQVSGAVFEDIALGHLVRLVPALEALLRACSFVLDHTLVVRRAAGAERWTGLPRRARPGVAFATGLVDDRPVLMRGGAVQLALWPLVRVAPPSAGAEPELFVFDGRGRHGARLVAGPAGYELHVAEVWDWFDEHAGREAEAARTAAEQRTPFPGLAPFSTADADVFVGREREVDAFVNRLRTRALHVVVGPSGAGKSSFVHAGVVPALPAGWRSITLRPGATPLATLARRLATVDPAAAGVLVVIVDQLEELFTLRAPADEQLRFAEQLAELAGDDAGPTRVICTVRDDFLMHAEGLAPLRGALGPALFLIGNPSRDELIRTLVEPARRAGYELSDPALAGEMVDAVADQRGALSLLAFTAARLWELRDRRLHHITRAAYEAIGGIGGALGRHAEATLAALTGDQPRIAAAIFRELVTAEGTRAVVPRAELAERVPNADPVIDTLIAARLVAISDRDAPHVEIVHEALIAAWPRLAAWAREDVEGARVREQLRGAIAQWDRRGRPRSLLWRDELLADLERWRARPGTALGELERTFADASRAAARRSRRLRRLAIAVALVVLAATSLVMFRLRQTAVQREAAVRQQLIASRIAQARTELLDGRSWAALASIVAAQQLGATGPVIDTMRGIARRSAAAIAARITLRTGRIWDVRYSPDGNQLAVAGEGGAQLWDARTAALVAKLDERGVRDAVFDAAGARVAVIGFDGTLAIYDARTGARVQAMQTHNTVVRCVAWRPDGAWIGTAGEEGVVEIWNPSTGARQATLTLDGNSLASSCDFAAPGFVVGARSGDVVLVDPDTGTAATLGHHAKWARAVAFDRSGTRLVTAGHDQSVKLWDVAARRVVRELTANAEIVSATFDPSGTRVAVSARDGTVRVWDVATGQLAYVLAEHHGTAWFVEFSPDGRRVLTTADDGSVRVWDAATGMPLVELEGHTAAVLRARFSPSSTQLASASYDGSVVIWRGDVAASAAISAGAPGCTARVGVTGHWIAVACRDGVQLWNATTSARSATLPGAALADVSETRAVTATGTTVSAWSVPGGTHLADASATAPITAVATAGDRFAFTASDASATIVSPGSTTRVALSAVANGVALLSGDRWLVRDAARLRLYAGTRELWSTPVLPDQVLDMMASPSYGWVAVVGAKDVWLYRDGANELVPLAGHQAAVLGVAFDRDERRAVSTSEDGSAIVWDLATRRPLRRLISTGQYFAAAVFDESDRAIVAIDGTGKLHLFDAETGDETARVAGGVALPTAFVRSGELYTAVGRTGAIATWRIAPDRDPLAAAERDLACKAPPDARVGACR